MAFIKTRDDVNLYVKDWGAGRPVILLHGWPLSADSWDDQAIALAEAGYRTIAYDRRGFGRSDQPWSGYDYDTLTDDLADVIQATGVSDFTLVGFSMGGGEVARYMSRYDGKGVVQAGLISSIVPYMLKTEDNPNGTPKEIFDQITTGIKKDRAAFFAGFFEQFYGDSLISHPVSQEIIDWSLNVTMQASLKAILECAKSFGTTDLRPELAAFRVPTLIIHGTEDKTVPIDPAGRAAAQGIAGSTLIEYEGSAHGTLASDKDRVTSDLLNFLKG